MEVPSRKPMGGLRDLVHLYVNARGRVRGVLVFPFLSKHLVASSSLKSVDGTSCVGKSHPVSGFSVQTFTRRLFDVHLARFLFLHIVHYTRTFDLWGSERSSKQTESLPHSLRQNLGKGDIPRDGTCDAPLEDLTPPPSYTPPHIVILRHFFQFALDLPSLSPRCKYVRTGCMFSSDSAALFRWWSPVFFHAVVHVAQ